MGLTGWKRKLEMIRFANPKRNFFINTTTAFLPPSNLIQQVCVTISLASDARSILNPLDWQPTIKIGEEFLLRDLCGDGSRAEAIARIVETISKSCILDSDRCFTSDIRAK